jgi:hypothetical protein
MANTLYYVRVGVGPPYSRRSGRQSRSILVSAENSEQASSKAMRFVLSAEIRDGHARDGWTAATQSIKRICETPDIVLRDPAY